MVVRHSWKSNPRIIVPPPPTKVRTEKKSVRAPLVRIEAEKPAVNVEKPFASKLEEARFSCRSTMFAALINVTSYGCVYDFGCGICKLKTLIGDRIYVGIDIVQKVPDVMLHNLVEGLPNNLESEKSKRLAIAAGLLEYLPDPFEFILSVLEEFDSFYFSYSFVAKGAVTATKYKKTIIRSPSFEEKIKILCSMLRKNLSITPFDKMPEYRRELDGQVPQNIYLVTSEVPGA